MNQTEKQIVIVEAAPTDMLAKIARALKKQGYETILISLLESRGNFSKKAYNKIISFNFKFFRARLVNLPKILLYGVKKFSKILKALSEIRKLKPHIVIGRATPSWLCVLTMKYFKKSLFVYFPYDFRSFCYKDLNEAKRYTPEFEIKAERYCFENSDGIIYKGVKNKLDFLDEKVLGKNLKIRAPLLHILPYCSEELLVPINKDKLSKKDGEIHLAFVGHIGVESSWKNSVKMMLDQRLHLHLYGKTAYLTAKESEKREEHESFLKNKYFHLHKQLDQTELIKEISKYDYGTWLGYYDLDVKNTALETGNKFATYLEAGLPVIYFKNHKYIGKSLEEQGAGIGITIKSPLRKILKRNKLEKYKKMEKDIEKNRQKIIVEKQIPRLEKFFQEAKKYRFSKEKI